MTEMKQIMITFNHRTVMHGYVSEATYETLMDPEADITKRRFSIHDFTIVIKWNTSGGVTSLAAHGPVPEAKLSVRAPRFVCCGSEINGCWALTTEAEIAWSRR